MTTPVLPDSIVERIRSLEDRVAQLVNRVPNIPGVTVNSAGQVFFPGGAVFGGGGGSTLITSPSVIPPPTNLVLTPASDSDTVWIDVSWDAPTGNASDQVSGYLIKYKRHVGQVIPEVVTTKDLHIRLGNLIPLIQYDIEVYASTRLGNLSDALSASTTTIGDTTPPGPVTGIILDHSVGAVSARWDDNPEVDVAAGVGQYELQVDSSVTFNSNAGEPDFSQLITGTSGSFVGLAPGTDYYLRVRAIDSSQNAGPFSPVDSPSSGLAYIPFHSDPAPGLDVGSVIGGGNVLSDSSFESDDYSLNWTVNTPSNIAFTQSTSDHHGLGTKCLVMTDSNNAASGYLAPSAAILTNEGDQWVISAWIKLKTASPTFSFRIIYQDNLNTAETEITDVGTGEWKRLIYTFTVPAGKTSFTPRLMIGNASSGAVTGELFLDEVQLELGQIATGYAPKANEILPNSISGQDLIDSSILAGKLDFPSNRDTPTNFLVHAGSGNPFNGIQFSGINGDLTLDGSNLSTIASVQAFSGVEIHYDGLWNGTGTVPLVHGPLYRGLERGQYKAVFYLRSLDNSTQYTTNQRFCKIAVHHASSTIIPQTDQFRYVIAQDFGNLAVADGVSTSTNDTNFHAISIPFHVAGDMSSISGLELYVSAEDSQIAGQGFNMKSRTWELSHIVIVPFNALVQSEIVSEYIAASSIQAGHLQAGSVVADKLAAGVVTTEKLTIGNVGDSAILNGGFEDRQQGSTTRAASFSYDYEVTGAAATYDLVPASTIGGGTGATIQKVTLSGVSGTAIATTAIPVTPGEQWYLSTLAADDRANSAHGSFYLRVLFGTTVNFARNDAGVQAIDVVAGASISSPLQRYDGAVTVPSNVSFMRVSLYNWVGTGAGVHSMYFDDVTARKVTISAQIADGAITATKILAGAVIASKLSVLAGGGNHVLNSSFEDSNASARGAPGIGDTGFLNWNKYTTGSGSAPTTTRVTTSTKHGAFAARLQWTTNTGFKGIKEAVPVGPNGTTVWPAGSTWMISLWVFHQVSSVGVPTIPSDNTGFTDSFIVQPAAVQGQWQRYIMKRVVGASTVASNVNLAWTHANGDLLLDAIQVEEGDVATGYAPSPDELLPGTIQATNIAAGAISSGSGVFGTIDAGDITAGTILAARLGSATYPIGIIFSSTLSSANITVNGGSIKVGNPPTTGLILNSQGMTLYAGGVATATLDATTGNVGLTGTIVATGGQLQTLDVTGTLTMQSGGLLRTRNNSGAPGIEIAAESFGVSEISFFTGSESSSSQRGFLQVSTGGALSLSAPNVFGPPGQILFLANSASIGTSSRTGATFRSSGSDDLFNNVVAHGLIDGRDTVSTIGQYCVGTNYNGFVAPNAGSSLSPDFNWGLGVQHPLGASAGTSQFITTLRYSPNNSGDLLERGAGIYDAGTNTVIAAAWNDRQFYYLSSGKQKDDIRTLTESSLDKLMNLRPVRHKMKDGSADVDHIGLIAEEVEAHIPEASKCGMITPGALIATLVHGVQEQQKRIEELERRMANK